MRKHEEMDVRRSEAARRPPLTLRALGSLTALRHLRGEWAALWERCPDATVFQRPEWLLSWGRRFLSGSPLVLTLRAEGRLVGLFPLWIDASGAGRSVSLWGGGVSDYLDILIEPALAQAGVEAFWGWLEEHRALWDVCDFTQLRPGSPLFQGAAPRGWSEQRKIQEYCPVLALPERPEALMERLSARTRSHIRGGWRRLERHGRVHIEEAAHHNLSALLEALFSLHSARWQRCGLPGVLEDSEVQEFHREVAPVLLSRGALLLYGLLLDKKIIAMFYGFQDKGRVFCYLGGFDPEFARLSPGMLIMAYTVERAIKSGARELDFLRGQESYKYKWGAKDRPLYQRMLWRPEAKRAHSTPSAFPRRESP